MNWLANNIVPAWNDGAWTVLGGGATVASDMITLPINSTVRLLLEKGNVILGSSLLKIVVGFSGTFKEDEEYNPNCSLDIRIVYLDDSVQRSKVLFTKSKVIGTNYEDETHLEVDVKSIKTLDIKINNYSTALAPLYINYLEIYKSEDINKGQVTQAVNESITLLSVERYDNGCVINYRGDNDPLFVEFIADDTTSQLIGCLVDEVDFITCPRIHSNMPSKEAYINAKQQQ